MSEISNKTLATLLVLAIVASLGGTMMVLNKQTPLFLTGFANNQTGNVTLNVTAVVSIALNTGTVAFGQVQVHSDFDNCTLITDGTSSAGCASFTNVTSGLRLENTGNTDVKICVNSTNSSVTSFLGSTAAGYSTAFYMLAVDNTTAGGAETGGCNDIGDATGLNVSGTYVNVSIIDSTVANATICDNLNFEDSTDLMEINLKIGVPKTTDPGVKRDELYFKGVESTSSFTIC